MNSTPPTAFSGAPDLNPNRPGPTPASGYVPAGRPVLSRVVPTLTVYAEGLVNLNTEASAFFLGGVCLHPPAPVRAGRTPAPWQISTGPCNKLLPVNRDKPAGSMRFRVDPDGCPPEGRYLLAPVVGHHARFLLVPG